MNELDKVVAQAYAKLPYLEIISMPHCAKLYGKRTNFIDVGYQAVMKEAVPMLRHRKVRTRADAVELAYDFLLQRGAKEWSRIGEVILLREEGIARALCTK